MSEKNHLEDIVNELYSRHGYMAVEMMREGPHYGMFMAELSGAVTAKLSELEDKLNWPTKNGLSGTDMKKLQDGVDSYIALESGRVNAASNRQVLVASLEAKVLADEFKPPEGEEEEIVAEVAPKKKPGRPKKTNRL